MWGRGLQTHMHTSLFALLVIVSRDCNPRPKLQFGDFVLATPEFYLHDFVKPVKRRGI